MTKLSEVQVIKIFDDCNAHWVHSGDPEEPHAKLTDGTCGHEYFNYANVMRYPKINRILAGELFSRLIEAGIKDNPPDYVIGSAYSAITLSYEVAHLLNAMHVFPKKSCASSEGLVFKTWTIPSDANVLQIEETTSLKTVAGVRRAVVCGNESTINFSPIVGTVVFRPRELRPEYTIGHQKIEVVSLITKEIPVIHQEKCELCRAGSKRYTPKDNWNRLVKRI